MGNSKKISDTNWPRQAKSCIKIRYLIALLATLCPVVCYIGRQNLSMAIVAMVNEMVDQTSQSQSQSSSSSKHAQQLEQIEKTHLDNNQMITCPRPIKTTADQPTKPTEQQYDQMTLNKSENNLTLTNNYDEFQSSSASSISTTSSKYNWTSGEQSLVLGAFFWTYVIFQIPAARFAELIGAKWVLATATIGSCLLSLASPWAASISVYGLFLIRALMGICQTALYPACYVLYSQWLPPMERSQALPILGVAAYLGSIVASSSTGYFIQSASFGWEFAFYMPGILCAIWSFFWILIGASKPREHPSISLEEIDYIESKMKLSKTKNNSTNNSIENSGAGRKVVNGNNDNGSQVMIISKKQISWMKLFRSRQIWAMIAAFFASNWSFAIVLLLLPTYLNDILHMEPLENGMINSTIYILYCISSPIVGSISTMMVETRLFGLSRLNVRKLFQGIALFGNSICFSLLPTIGCDTRQVMIILFIQIILFSFVNGGEVQLPNEISADFSGTVYAIGNCVGSSTGFIVPMMRSLIIDDTLNRSQWATFFYVGAIISSLGGLIFVIFGRCDLKDYSNDNSNNLFKKTTTATSFDVGCCGTKNKFYVQKSIRLHKNETANHKNLTPSVIPSTFCHCLACKSWKSRALDIEQGGAASLTMTTQW